jgi:hypothetical protein
MECKGGGLVPAPQVFKNRYGVSQMSGWRWMNDPSLGFPVPVKSGTATTSMRMNWTPLTSEWQPWAGAQRPPLN